MLCVGGRGQGGVWRGRRGVAAPRVRVGVGDHGVSVLCVLWAHSPMSRLLGLMSLMSGMTLMSAQCVARCHCLESRVRLRPSEPEHWPGPDSVDSGVARAGARPGLRHLHRLPHAMPPSNFTFTALTAYYPVQEVDLTGEMMKSRVMFCSDLKTVQDGLVG